jgi:hypothetical protein
MWLRQCRIGYTVVIEADFMAGTDLAALAHVKKQS